MIDHVYILDHDEKYAPPEQPVLEVGLVGDVVFLTIGKYEETTETRTFEAMETTAVPAADLVNAIKVLALSQNRHDLAKALGTDRDLRVDPR